MKRSFRRQGAAFILLLWCLLAPIPVPAQCVPEMNDIREEIHDIHVTALQILHRKAADEAADGWKAVQKGKLSKAARLFRHAIRKDPNCWYALVGLAHSAFLRGNAAQGKQWYTRSRSAFDHVRTQAPRIRATLRECRTRLAAVMRRLDRHESMYHIQDKGESYDPSHQQQVVQAMDDWLAQEMRTLDRQLQQGYPVRLLMPIGNDLARSGAWPSAESVYREALAAEPDNGILHANLAACLLAQGRIPEARAHATRAIELGAPLHPELAARLGLPTQHRNSQ